MAVISVREIWNGRAGSRDDRSVREYTRTFRVVANNSHDGPLTALLSAGIPGIFSSYVDANGVGDAGALCRRVSVRQESDDQPYTWEVECEYSSKHEDQEQQDDNPLLRLPELEFGFQRHRKSIQQDAYEKPLVNSSGEPFDPPIEIDDSRPVLRITRNEATFNPALAVFYQDAINSDEFMGNLPGTAKIANLRAIRKKENNLIYWEVTYEIEFRWDGWFMNLLDQGMYELDPINNEPEVIRAPKDGQPLTKPSLLNGIGEKLSGAKTTLFVDVNDNNQVIFVGNELNFGPVPFDVLIDSEIMEVTAVNGQNLTVKRGAKGTTAAAHVNGAAVTQRPVYLPFRVYRELSFKPLNLG